MGRHHVKLPDHLYLSPPSTEPSSAFSSASSFFSLKPRISQDSTSTLFPSTYTSRAFRKKIPGFNTSAAFFSALRANIDLQTDSPESPANTPDSLRPIPLSSSVTSLLPLSPLSKATSATKSYMDADPQDGSTVQLPESEVTEIEEEVVAVQPEDPASIPDLTTFAAVDEASRIEALRLVADSVAQQRQIASRALILHPITIAVLVGVVSLLHRYFYKGEVSDYAIMGTTFAGIVMAIMVTIRGLVGSYIEEAERIGTWKWLKQGREQDAEKETGKKVLGDADEILVTKFGDEFIGAVVFRGVQPVDESSASTKKTRKAQSSSNQNKTEIRAWTVKQRYRRKEIGMVLLEDAIKSSYEHGWASGGIEIAPDHANSRVVLPPMFTGFVHKNTERAQKYLDKKVQEHSENKATGKGGKKRR